jgi:hypothetical protein
VLDPTDPHDRDDLMANHTAHPPSTEINEARVRIEAAAVILSHAILDGSVFELNDETCTHVLTMIDQAGRWLERAA